MSTRTGSVSSSVEAADEVALPHVELVPKRYRWLKRLIILSGALVVGLVILRGWWGFEVNRRLHAQIEQYRAAGQPVYASEFDAELDAVPDEENAAVLLEQAINTIVSSTESGVRIEDFLYEPNTIDGNLDAAKELIESNAAALTLARRARKRPQVAWSQRLTNRATTFNPGALTAQRSLAMLLWFSASYDYRMGNHAEAIETVYDLLAFSEAVASHPTPISSLVGWACYDLGLTVLEDSAAGLSVESRDREREDEVHSASRALIEKLIRSLIDEASTRHALNRSYLGDRAGTLERVSSAEQFGPKMLGGNTHSTQLLWFGLAYRFGRPLFVLDIIRAMKLSTLSAEAASEENWPSAEAYFPASAGSPSLLRALTRPLTDSSFGGAYETSCGSIQAYFKHLARRRMAATALAVRLFEIDYGRRPYSLHELVQEYLSAVPVDPFLGDGTAIRYGPDPDASVLYSVWDDNAVLYSVGDNGKDDWGITSDRGNITDRQVWEYSDIVFYLDGRPETRARVGAKVSEQAGENDEDAQDDER